MSGTSRTPCFISNCLKISITQKENNVISTDKLFDGKVIIDTTENLTNEQINKYEEEIKNYYNGAVILQDKVILKTNMELLVLKDLSIWLVYI